MIRSHSSGSNALITFSKIRLHIFLIYSIQKTLSIYLTIYVLIECFKNSISI